LKGSDQDIERCRGVINYVSHNGCAGAAGATADFTQDQANCKQDYEPLWFKVKQCKHQRGYGND
jgi:hypothetical protein